MAGQVGRRWQTAGSMGKSETVTQAALTPTPNPNT